MGAGGVAEGVKPVAAMVVVQVVFAGVNIFYKLAVVCDGMDMRVLVAYRYLFASAVLAPLAYFIERKNRTKMTWRVLMLSFVCGLVGGSLAQNLYISGMKLTSATFATAMTNLIPAITFVLAVLFRYERLAIRTAAGQAKVAGTLIGVGGAMLLTFYKGAEVTPWHTHLDLVAALQSRHHSTSVAGEAAAGNRVMGSMLVIGSCFFYALWLILQAKLSREYPFHYSSTALMCVMSGAQSAAFALCLDRDAAQWRLGLDIRLLSVVYTGVLASGVMLVVLSWCVKRRGPLFASVFNPLMLVVVAVLGSLLLAEKLHLGTLLGAVLIVIGLYAVLWGKGRETAVEAAKVGDDHQHIDVVVVVQQQQQQQRDEEGDAAAATAATTTMAAQSAEESSDRTASSRRSDRYIHRSCGF
ncbi:WAT1-related protein At1g68170-like [Oryza brachyantha]|uniref:WAT1-related protein At1g68170-like n=1 Tax=Oryza brachyantha TaxID=4533 RepID=UPI001ADC6092|nr:WAT1-related protein At1g68170-like [Oryza brachyantha]